MAETEREARPLSLYLSLTLRTGALAALALIVVGLLWAGASGYRPGESPVLPIAKLFRSAMLLSPLGVLNLGMLVLLLTPIAGLVVAGTVFLLEKDWRYAAVSGAVLLVLSAGTLLSA